MMFLRFKGRLQRFRFLGEPLLSRLLFFRSGFFQPGRSGAFQFHFFQYTAVAETFPGPPEPFEKAEGKPQVSDRRTIGSALKLTNKANSVV